MPENAGGAGGAVASPNTFVGNAGANGSDTTVACASQSGLVAGGGQGGQPGFVATGDIVVSGAGGAGGIPLGALCNALAVPGQAGQSGSSFDFFGGSGGSAAAGGHPGYGTNSNFTLRTLPQNGQQPGGGGGGSGPSDSATSISPGGNGAAGAVVISW